MGIWARDKSIDDTSRWSAVTAFVCVLLFNGIAGGTSLLGGMNTAEVSDAYPTLFTPAAITFAIWSLIYVLLAAFCLYLYGIARPKKPTIAPEIINSVLHWFTFSSLLNALWILAWQYQLFWLSVVFIVGMLFSLAKVVEALRTTQPTGWEYVLVKLPFSIYFGWITVAVIANVCVWLVSAEWGAFGIRPGVWTVGLLLAGAGIALTATICNNDWAYLTVFVWAYAGILLNHLSPDGYNGAYPTIIIALSVLLAVFIAIIFQLVMPRLQSLLRR